MIKKKLSNGVGQIVINNDIVDSLKKALSNKYVTQVGILGSGSARDDKGNKQQATNAEIGAAHEFGIMNEKQRLPRRSFLKMPLLRSAKEIFERKQKLVVNIKKAIENGTSKETAWYDAFVSLGTIAEQVVQRAFEQGGPGWPPLKLRTLMNKKSWKKLSKWTEKKNDQILVDTGQLRASISSRVIKK